MCGLAAVAHRLAHHDRTEAVLQRVHRRRAHAARGRAAGDHQRVDTLGYQAARQIGAEEGRGVFLHQRAFSGREAQPRVQLGPVAAGGQRLQSALFQRPDPGVRQIRLVVAHGGKEHRLAAGREIGDQCVDRHDLRRQVRAQRQVGIGETLDDIDHHQRRAAAETDGLPEATGLEGLFVHEVSLSLDPGSPGIGIWNGHRGG